MLLGFLIFSFVLSLWLGIIWSTNSIVNSCLKMIFIIQTIWAGLLLLAHYWPMVNSGQIRLI